MKNIIVNKLSLIVALLCGFIGLSYAECKNYSDRGNHKLHIIVPYGILDNYGGASSLSVNMTCLIKDLINHHYHIMHNGFTYDVASSLYISTPHECQEDTCAEDYNVELNGKSISGIKSVPKMKTGDDIYILLKPTGNNINATTVSSWTYVPKP